MNEQQEDLELADEIYRITCAQQEFGAYMRSKLRDQCLKGKRGWDDQKCKQGIKLRMADCVDRLLTNNDYTQAIDVANFAMMLYFLGKTEREENHEPD